MRRRLLLSYVSLALIVLVALEVPLGLLFARHERTRLLSQGLAEATGLSIAATEDVQHGRVANLSALADRYHAAAGDEVLVRLAPRGRTVDSDHDEDSEQWTTGLVATAARGGHASALVADEGRSFAVTAVPIRPETNADTAGRGIIGELVLSMPANAAFARIRTAWLLLAAFALAVLALSAVVGARLAASLSRPIARLGATVGRLGAGDLTVRAEPAGPAELRALADQFNQMAEELQHLVGAQVQFVTDASHQLRSPLTALRLRLENLESSTDGVASSSVAAANREVERLSRLVDGLLTLSRADESHPAAEPTDVAAVVAERVEAWSALADERDVTLRAATDALRDPWAPLVPGDLEQILDNLLSNALEATPPGRSITVDAVDSGWGIDLAVNDEGLGMADDERTRAFDRFWQGPRHGTGTSGIGLAIVQELARRNGATVELLPGPLVPAGHRGPLDMGRGVSALIRLHR